MSNNLYQNLAESKCGYLIAPAGCGKTEAIVKCVKNFDLGKQLILTHTHAGVSALKKKFKNNEVDSKKYHIDTISGWALKWVSQYPKLSEYNGCLPIPNNDDWPKVYLSANRLLKNAFVIDVIKFSYTGILVDEYQDCTVPMHNLIVGLKNILPCRILGDPLQAIFSINKHDPLIEWGDAIQSFEPKLGEMTTPHRWINVGNKALGDWLIGLRQQFEQGTRPSFKNSFVKIQQHEVNARTSKLKSLAGSLDGSICVIGAKHGNHDPKLISALVNIGFHLVEPNELPALQKFVTKLLEQNNSAEQGRVANEFLSNSFAGIASNKKFVEDILIGRLKKNPSNSIRKELYFKYPNGYSHSLLIDLINYLFASKLKCKRMDSIKTLRRVLERANEKSEEDLLKLLSDEIILRKILAKDRPTKCIGSTLLLKGLEFDHCIILFSSGDKGWEDLKDLYVALTRGRKTIHFFEA